MASKFNMSTFELSTIVKFKWMGATTMTCGEPLGLLEQNDGGCGPRKPQLRMQAQMLLQHALAVSDVSSLIIVLLVIDSKLSFLLGPEQLLLLSRQ